MLSCCFEPARAARARWRGENYLLPLAAAPFITVVVISFVLYATMGAAATTTAAACDVHAPASFTATFFGGLTTGCGLLLALVMANPIGTSEVGVSVESVSALVVFGTSAFHFTFLALGAAPVMCVRSVGGWSTEVRPQVPQEYLFWFCTTVSMLTALGRLVKLPLATQRDLGICIGVLLTAGAVATFTESLPAWIAGCAISFIFHVVVSVQIWLLFNNAFAQSQNELTRRLLLWIRPISLVIWYAFPLLWLLGQFSALPPTAEFLVWPILDFFFKGSISLLLVMGCFFKKAQAALEVLTLAEERRMQAQLSKDGVSRQFLRWTLHELRVPLQGALLAAEEIQDGLTSGELVTAVPSPPNAAAAATVAGGSGTPIEPATTASGNTVNVAVPDSGAPPAAAASAGSITPFLEAGTMAINALLQVSTILDDFLSLSKIEDGRFELEPNELSLQAWLSEATSVFTNSLRVKRMQLHVSTAPDMPRIIYADGNRLRQVLSNYLSNAIKFSPAASDIKVRLEIVCQPPTRVESSPKHNKRNLLMGSRAGARAAAVTGALGSTVAAASTVVPATTAAGTAHSGGGSGGGLLPYLRLHVEDCGPGIAPEEIAILFQPYNQIRAGSLQKGGGTGLGLALCKKIVELAGGSVGVSSKVGVGSRFWFEVPLLLSAPTPDIDISPTETVRLDAEAASATMADALSTSAAASATTTTDAIAVVVASGAAPSPTSATSGAAAGDPPLPTLAPQLVVETRGLSPTIDASRLADGTSSSDERRTAAAATPTPSRPLASSVARGRRVGASWLADGGSSRRSGSGRLLQHTDRAAAALRRHDSPATSALTRFSNRSADTLSPPASSALRPAVPGASGTASPILTGALTAPEAPPLRRISRVVVVDDVYTNRELFARMLRRNGCEVVFTAEDGQGCLDKLAAVLAQKQSAAAAAAGPPSGDDVVDAWFVDGVMPVMDGLELTRRLRSSGVRAPIIAVSGNALDADRDKFIAAGAVTVLAKPVVRLHEVLAAAGLRLPRDSLTKATPLAHATRPPLLAHAGY